MGLLQSMEKQEKEICSRLEVCLIFHSFNYTDLVFLQSLKCYHFLPIKYSLVDAKMGMGVKLGAGN